MESTLRKILLSVLLYTCISIGCFAQNQYKIYAGLIYHFAKYTQWPASNAEIVVGVMGKTALNQEINVLNGKVAGTSKISIREVKEISDLSSCNIVFVPGSLSGRFNDITAHAKQHNTLLISDSPGATKGGIVINFFEEDSKVKFEISNKNAATCGLKISSDLQKLAKVID